MADYNFTADHAENNMACDVSITFVDELRDFDVEKSGKNRRRRESGPGLLQLPKKAVPMLTRRR